MNKILSIVTLFVLMVPVIWGQDTVTDIDGNVYQTVQIGKQLWMEENLKVTHYRNGDEISTGFSGSEWWDLDETETGAYCVYGDDRTFGLVRCLFSVFNMGLSNESNDDTYGYLYNWYAVDDNRGVCPDDWHVPTDGEWTVLKDFITNDGYAEIEGNALKEIGYEHWNDDGNPDHEGLDIYGFTALPGGMRTATRSIFTKKRGGAYIAMGEYVHFWSSTEYDSSTAWGWMLLYNNSVNIHPYGSKEYGYSVRCLKD